MRIQDKYKSKPKPKPSSSGGGDGNTTTTAPPPPPPSAPTPPPPPPPPAPVTNIHACIESGDLVGVESLITQIPSSLNETNAYLIQTPLHVAASLNRVDIMTYLLDWPGPGTVELEAKNVYGESPLHEAAKNGCNDAVKMLLQYGANVEATTNNSMTPLHLAVGYALRCGDNSVVKTLSEFNADFSAQDDEGMMPLNYLPSGVENDELMRLCQVLAEQMNNVTQQINVYTEQISYTASNTVIEYQTVEEPRYFDSGMKGKMEEFDYELSKIVGLHDLKMQLQRWAKGMLLDEKRRAMGIDLGPRKPPHMAFLGNPGTGKTTVARILGKLLCSVGVLSSDNVTEVQRTDLVGEFLGQTGPKTRKKIEEAMGGILFVDEAYRLCPAESGGNSIEYGVEALEEIMSVLEDGQLLVIFAGYTEPMKRVFSSNEGFCRRVTHFFQFDDFSCKDLAEMLLIKMRKQDERSRLFGFRLDPRCTLEAVVSVVERKSSEKMRKRMNGGLVDHMLNNARENLDSRLSFDSKGDELLTITLADLETGLEALARRANLDEDDEKKSSDHNVGGNGEKANVVAGVN